MVRYDDCQDQRKQKCKRGFSTKREAQYWEWRFLFQTNSDLDMTFKDFYEIYKNYMKIRFKENIWEHTAHIIKSKILPYFGDGSDYLSYQLWNADVELCCPQGNGAVSGTQR